MKNKAINLMICLMLISSLCGCKSEQTTHEVFNSEAIAVPTAEPTQSPLSSPELKLPLEGKIICIDAGHGISGNTETEPIAPGSSEKKRSFVSGTTGKNQTEEQLNLKLALKLEALLKSYGAIVHMTRTAHETKLSNIGRAKFANNLNADLSVKIHADGGNPSASGISMLVPSNKYISEQLCEISRRAGEIVLKAVIKETGAKNRGIIERSDMTGFNWSSVPVILIETGFMTNPEEDALLETDEYCDKIITGIASGVIEFFNK